MDPEELQELKKYLKEMFCGSKKQYKKMTRRLELEMDKIANLENEIRLLKDALHILERNYLSRDIKSVYCPWCSAVSPIGKMLEHDTYCPLPGLSVGGVERETAR